MDPAVARDLLTGARDGDQASWDAIVAEFSSLLWAIARSHRLDRHLAADVVQGTWLKLVDNLDTIREPGALPGWLSTTCRRECLRVLRREGRSIAAEPDHLDRIDPFVEDVDADLIRDERARVLWRALGQLRDACQRLLRILMADPAPGYDEVSEMLDIPIGSIGPTRGRCLAQLRTIIEESGALA